MYATVDDIDLWVGGLLEPKAPGSILGITFRDIIADQFVRLKKGDKYFFDHDPSVNPGHFTLGIEELFTFNPNLYISYFRAIGRITKSQFITNSLR